MIIETKAKREYQPPEFMTQYVHAPISLQEYRQVYQGVQPPAQ